MPDEEGATVEFVELPEDRRLPMVPQPTLLHALTDNELFCHASVTPWAVPDYLEALNELADAFDLEPAECARRYGFVELPAGEAQVWRYHPALGFSRWRG